MTADPDPGATVPLAAAPAAPVSSVCRPARSAGATIPQPVSRYDTEEWLEWINAAKPDDFSHRLDAAEKAGAYRWIVTYAACVCGPTIRRLRLAGEGRMAQIIADAVRVSEGKECRE